MTEQCRSVQPSVTCVSSVLAFAHARFNRSMESIISNQLTSEIPGAYQAPELAMSEWCRNTAHSIEKPTIRQL